MGISELIRGAIALVPLSPNALSFRNTKVRGDGACSSIKLTFSLTFIFKSSLNSSKLSVPAAAVAAEGFALVTNIAVAYMGVGVLLFDFSSYE